MNRAMIACALALAVAALPAAAQSQRLPAAAHKRKPPPVAHKPGLAPTAATQPARVPGPEILIGTPETVSPTPILRGVLPIGDTAIDASLADYPAASRAAGDEGWVRIRLSIGQTGAVLSCAVVKAHASPTLEAAACPFIRRKGRFRHALDSKGAAVAAEVESDLIFTLMPRPPVMVQVPAALPAESGAKLLYRSKFPPFTIAREPAWRDFAPTGGKNPAEVVARITQFPARFGAPDRRYCDLVDSSGDPALDQATCEALKVATYRGGAPGRSATQLFLVRWRDGNANFSIPKLAHGEPLKLVDEHQQDVTVPGTSLHDAAVELVFGADGRLGCTVTESTGSDEADIALCAQLRSHVLFTPESDAFGRNVETRRSIEYTFSQKH